MVLDSRVGALDRTLGFLFGLGPRPGHRGYSGPSVLQLAGSRPLAAGLGLHAKSKVVLSSTGHWLMSLLPDDPKTPF